jgi:hypothetical protein
MRVASFSQVIPSGCEGPRLVGEDFREVLRFAQDDGRKNVPSVARAGWAVAVPAAELVSDWAVTVRLLACQERLSSAKLPSARNLR